MDKSTLQGNTKDKKGDVSMLINIKKRYTIEWLVILNLTMLLIFLLNKFSLPKKCLKVIFSVVIVPIIFAVFLFYILSPLKKFLLKSRLTERKAAIITLFVFILVLVVIGKYFGDYFIKQIILLKNMIIKIAEERNVIGEINNLIRSKNGGYDYFDVAITQIQGYIIKIISNAKLIFNKGLGLFSNILLVILILFYLLKDGEKVPEYILSHVSGKYKKNIGAILEEGDKVLSSYIIGQATVAASLAIMLFIGYWIIGMPSGILLATTTFILAFIPFIGFLISMIIPYVIAITIGSTMLLKLTVLFLIAQTLKGRLVVPLIMGRAMNIHPVMDIFLVVAAVTLIGPVGAFVVVPIYGLIRVLYRNFKPIEVREE